LGEGEITITELVSCLEKNGDTAKVSGILYRNNGDVLTTSPSSLVSDLDVLAFPIVPDPMKKENYVWTAPKKGEVPIASILTKRGCPFLCTFCSQHSMCAGSKNLPPLTGVHFYWTTSTCHNRKY
jgi:radical SAM superfamily enzyme YgiQ (UPF0313 family)